MKIYIRGFADTRKELERELSFHTEEIIEHIIKLTLMPNNSARNHWQGEIAGQLKSITRLKNSKKFPTAKQIYNWTYGKRQDLVTDRGWMGVAVRDVENQYKTTISKSIDEVCNDVDSVCIDYFKWLSDQLSNVGRVSSDVIYEKLDELL